MPLPKKDYFFTRRKDSASGIISPTIAVIDYPSFMHDYDSLGGFSGSPVFIQDSITNKWRIAGIFIANTFSDVGSLGIEYLLIEMIIKKIEEY
jgi:hypothetical protein